MAGIVHGRIVLTSGNPSNCYLRSLPHCNQQSTSVTTPWLTPTVALTLLPAVLLCTAHTAYYFFRCTQAHSTFRQHCSIPIIFVTKRINPLLSSQPFLTLIPHHVTTPQGPGRRCRANRQEALLVCRLPSEYAALLMIHRAKDRAIERIKRFTRAQLRNPEPR